MKQKFPFELRLIIVLAALLAFCYCAYTINLQRTALNNTAPIVPNATVAPTEPPLTSTPTPEPTPEPTEPEPTYPPLEGIKWYGDYRTYQVGGITTTTGGYEFDIDFLAKLLYREAGGMGWTGQVYVCSAILNLCDRKEMSLWDAGHKTNIFEVAPIVDTAIPTPMQYEVIEYVLNGGRIYGVCYFRTDYYHGFGRPVCKIENVCFSRVGNEPDPGYVIYDIPKSYNAKDMKSFELYNNIKDTTSRQYVLQKEYAYTNTDGIRMVNNRYCIALGSHFTRTIGQYVDIVLQNGTVIECILGDQKSDKHTDAAHIAHISDGSIVEFIIDIKSVPSEVRYHGDVSYLYAAWDSPVVQIIVYNINTFDA